MGKLIFTYSTMKAGKSLDLIRVHYNYANDTKVKIAVLKPETDTRDSGFVRSRTGSEVPVTFTIKKDQSILNAEILKYDVILVDEAQFLTDRQVKELHYLTLGDTIVMCWGLRIDYQGLGFEGSKALFTYANEIREIKTVCSCGKKATHHLLYNNGKLIANGSQIVIGDTEYKSVCGKCFSDDMLMKLTTGSEGEKSKMKIIKVSSEYIQFDNGSVITFQHNPDCCEHNYADFEQIEEQALKTEFDEQLLFEKVDGSGFRFGSKDTNMFFIPCYSDQNGYYSSDLDIFFDGVHVMNLECNWNDC